MTNHPRSPRAKAIKLTDSELRWTENAIRRAIDWTEASADAARGDEPYRAKELAFRDKLKRLVKKFEVKR